MISPFPQALRVLLWPHATGLTYHFSHGLFIRDLEDKGDPVQISRHRPGSRRSPTRHGLGTINLSHHAWPSFFPSVDTQGTTFLPYGNFP